jgi:hypothetical protein
MALPGLFIWRDLSARRERLDLILLTHVYERYQRAPLKRVHTPIFKKKHCDCSCDSGQEIQAYLSQTTWLGERIMRSSIFYLTLKVAISSARLVYTRARCAR